MDGYVRNVQPSRNPVWRSVRQYVSRPRRYWHGSSLYVIRDVWSVTKRPGLLRCEYAVRNPNGSKKWLPCVEGVQFAEIEPLRLRRHG